jgi:hypothetical protein
VFPPELEEIRQGEYFQACDSNGGALSLLSAAVDDCGLKDLNERSSERWRKIQALVELRHLSASRSLSDPNRLKRFVYPVLGDLHPTLHVLHELIDVVAL